MTKDLECPICGKVNKEQYETMENIICEDFYTCSNCGYWMDMAYSDYYDGIDLHSIKQMIPLIKNYKKARQFKISKCPF